MTLNPIQTAEKMKKFTEEIHLGTISHESDIFLSTMELCPALIYYIDHVTYTSGRGGVTMKVKYKNKDYPKERICEAGPHDIERLLRQSIERFDNKLVLIVPRTVNLKWIMKCFRIRLMGFYPNYRTSSWSSTGFKGCKYKALEITHSYRIGTVMLKTMEREVTDIIDRLVPTLFPIEMPDSVKCVIAHNYLAHTVEYCKADESDPLNMSWMHSAYGALKLGKCVCQGYAESYKRILDRAGVKCEFVNGMVLGEDGGPHAWNIVQVDSKRYAHVDVTFDASDSEVKKDYLFRGDSFLNGKRTWDRYHHVPCSEGKDILEEATSFCRLNRRKLLSSGLDEKWII